LTLPKRALFAVVNKYLAWTTVTFFSSSKSEQCYGKYFDTISMSTEVLEITTIEFYNILDVFLMLSSGTKTVLRISMHLFIIRALAASSHE
jgi:hypothetical protein